MDKERGGDVDYRNHLRDLAGDRSVLIRQEVGHGLNSTRINGHGVRLVRRPRITVGRVGVHRGVARAYAIIGRRWVRVFAVHGLHLRTSGRVAQDAYYATLAKRIHGLNRRGKPWIVGGDFNRNISDVASELGGTAHGEGIDGFVVSAGINVRSEGSDNTARRRGWSDHAAHWIDLTTTKEKP